MRNEIAKTEGGGRSNEPRDEPMNKARVLHRKAENSRVRCHGSGLISVVGVDFPAIGIAVARR